MRPQYWFSRAHLSAEDCDKIITFGESYPSQDGTVGLNDGNFGVNDMRRSIVRWLPRQSDVGHMMMQLFTHTNRDFAFDCAEIYNIQFTEYRGDNSGHYDWHADVSWGADAQYDRKLPMSIQLSDPDEYRGGDFELRNSNPPEGLRDRGSVIIFPAYLLHRVTPVTAGIRRSLVTWIEGPRWR